MKIVVLAAIEMKFAVEADKCFKSVNPKLLLAIEVFKTAIKVDTGSYKWRTLGVDPWDERLQLLTLTVNLNLILLS